MKSCGGEIERDGEEEDTLCENVEKIAKLPLIVSLSGLNKPSNVPAVLLRTFCVNFLLLSRRCLALDLRRKLTQNREAFSYEC